MKHKSSFFRFAFYILALFCVSSCITEEAFDNSPQDNLKSLWKTIDEHYCFFDEKAKLYGLDWDKTYQTYSNRISSTMSSEQLFEVCSDMVKELKDGHVNLSAAHDVARYWDWFESYPANFSDSLQRNYLGTDYYIASGIKYKILPSNVGYIYCESFDQGFGSGNLSEIFRHLALCSGVIVDVRNNSGGMLTSASDLAGCFTNEEVTAAYICHKTGKGHNDFSSPTAITISPAKGVRWQKPVIVLTNRKCYSAANSFVAFMRAMNNVVVIGDKTGGGAGLPFNSELPNGWGLRFSASPMYDAKMVSIEDGIEPDIRLDISSSDYNKGIDTMIEVAIDSLRTAKT